jgi:hypothetical protein
MEVHLLELAGRWQQDIGVLCGIRHKQLMDDGKEVFAL